MLHDVVDVIGDAVDGTQDTNAMPSETPLTPLSSSSNSRSIPSRKDCGDGGCAAAASATNPQQGNNGSGADDTFDQVIHSITAADVVCGRGRGDHEKWPGTVVYRKLVNQYREEYNTMMTSKARPQMIQQIVAEISSRNGRFVQKVAEKKTKLQKNGIKSKGNCKTESGATCDRVLANRTRRGSKSCGQTDHAADHQEDTWIVLPKDKVRKKVSDDLRRAIRRERVRIYHQVVADEGSHPHNVMERTARRQEARVSMVGHFPAMKQTDGVSSSGGTDWPSIAEERQPQSVSTKLSSPSPPRSGTGHQDASVQMAPNQQVGGLANPLVWPNQVATTETGLPLRLVSSSHSHLSIGPALQQASAWPPPSIASMSLPLPTSQLGQSARANDPHQADRSSMNSQALPSGLWDSLLCQANLMKSLHQIQQQQRQQQQHYLLAHLERLVQSQLSASEQSTQLAQHAQVASTSPMAPTTRVKSMPGAASADAVSTTVANQHERPQSVDAASEGRGTAVACVRE